MFLKYLDLQDVYTTEVFEWDKFMNPMVHMPWEMFTGYSRTFRGCCFMSASNENYSNHKCVLRKNHTSRLSNLGCINTNCYLLNTA